MADELKCIFGISEDKETVLIGIPAAGWEFMKDGRTHTFDLRSLGIPVRIALFGGKDRATLLASLKTTPETVNLTDIDFGFGPKG